MNNYCSDCIFLITNDSKCEGVYKCKMKEMGKQEKVYTNACSSACEKFEKCYNRNSYEKQQLYDLGKNANENESSIGVYLFGFLILLLVFIVAKLSGY